VTGVDADKVRAAEAAPDDTSYGDQWALPKIGWDTARDSVSPAGSAVVAVLDTGVDASHADLAGNLVAGTSVLDGSAGTTDPNGHGTAMAGIVAAKTNNGAGIAGVGYAGVKVMPVTVLGADGTGQDSDIINGVVHAADKGADVILMAFSNPGYSGALQAAVDYAWSKGAVLVAAAGNDGSSTPVFPAGDRGVVGVSNTTQDDTLNSSSNTGDSVFLGAPGTSIATLNRGGGVTTITGTSASAAVVAGSAAVLAANSSASNGVIVGRLARNADAAGTAEQTGNGRVNLNRALADKSTTVVKPAGATPVGDGRPVCRPVCPRRRGDWAGVGK
jgi:thermitase